MFRSEPNQGRTECKACPGGHYEEETGQSTNCSTCAAGQFLNATGSNTSTACKVCEKGTITALPGEGTCADCVAGKKQPNSNQSACLQCESGQFSAPKASKCTACRSGRHSSKSTECVDCIPGRFQKDGDRSECIKCIAGKFTSAPRQTACTPCASGKYAATAGQPACDVSTCTGGWFVGNATARSSPDCIECMAGQFKPDSDLSDGKDTNTNCSLCRPKTYGNSTGSKKCTDCQPGMDSNPGSTTKDECTCDTKGDPHRIYTPDHHCYCVAGYKLDSSNNTQVRGVENAVCG